MSGIFSIIILKYLLIDFYYLQDDRAIVPKRCKWMGWTINFANKKGQYIFAGTLAALGAICAYCYKNDKKMHYSFSELYDMIKNKFSN